LCSSAEKAEDEKQKRHKTPLWMDENGGGDSEEEGDSDSDLAEFAILIQVQFLESPTWDSRP
jgi:hypothetical protein